MSLQWSRQRTRVVTREKFVVAGTRVGTREKFVVAGTRLVTREKFVVAGTRVVTREKFVVAGTRVATRDNVCSGKGQEKHTREVCSGRDKSSDTREVCSGRDKSSDTREVCSGRDKSSDTREVCSGRDKSSNPREVCSGKDKSSDTREVCSGRDKSSNTRNVCSGRDKRSDTREVCSGRDKSSDTREVCSGRDKSSDTREVCSGRDKSSDTREVCSGRDKSSNPREVCSGRDKSSDTREVCSGRDKSSNTRDVCSGRDKRSDTREVCSGRDKSSDTREVCSGRDKSSDTREVCSGRDKSSDTREVCSGRDKSSDTRERDVTLVNNTYLGLWKKTSAKIPPSCNINSTTAMRRVILPWKLTAVRNKGRYGFKYFDKHDHLINETAEMASHYSAAITESETTSLENTDDITESEASVNGCHDSCETMSRCDTQRNLAAFWILGLCNNFAYVVMLSAAKDILSKTDHNGTHNATMTMGLDDGDNVYGGHRVPKCNHIGTGAILLADILPTLLVKMTGSLYIQFLPYSVRVILVVMFAVISLPVVSLSPVISISLLGVVFASLSGGLGELAFLGLMSHFNRNCVSTWSSGTGGAGLFGSLSYAGMTSAGLSPRVSLLVVLVVPGAMAASYFLLLVKPRAVTMKANRKVNEEDKELIVDENHPKDVVKQMSIKEKVIIIKSLLPYMIPLALVYFAEYTINQALFELVQFPSTWLSFSQQYRWYQVLYQVGVFASRSSVNLIRIKQLWLLPVLQFVNLGVILLHVLFNFIPSVWIMFGLILFEGVLGGAAYVNTFYNIVNQEPPDRKEFSMGVVSIADAAGIAVAGAVAVPLHNFLCTL
ncbi:Battenin [Lamellibrachia satsuma]|nr:Battenin [Lamellibrachia satsuma]